MFRGTSSTRISSTEWIFAAKASMRCGALAQPKAIALIKMAAAINALLNPNAGLIGPSFWGNANSHSRVGAGCLKPHRRRQEILKFDCQRLAMQLSSHRLGLRVLPDKCVPRSWRRLGRMDVETQCFLSSAQNRGRDSPERSINDAISTLEKTLFSEQSPLFFVFLVESSSRPHQLMPSGTSALNNWNAECEGSLSK